MEKTESVLLFWDANKNGSNMLKNAVESLTNSKIKLSRVLYLVCDYIYKNDGLRDECDKKNAKERIEELKKFSEERSISFAECIIPSAQLPKGKADNIKAVENMLTHYIFPKVAELNPTEVHITLTTGTQSMRFAWISLYTKSLLTRSFGNNVNVWQHRSDRGGDSTNYHELYKVDVDKNPSIDSIEKEVFESADTPPVNLDSEGKIARNATVDVPMLILGERGTGKSTLIKTTIVPVKLQNGYISKPEIQTVVCGQLDSTLAEDELFGHKRGAFTGAVKNVEGKIELADGGILFLDEIQDLPKSIQRKLLRVLQEKKFKRIGQNDVEKVSNFRLICASNNTLAELQKKLDPDFFDRIATFISFTKPLREHNETLQEEIWNNRWIDAQAHGFQIPRTPDNFSLVKETLAKSNMKGNIRDVEQLIAYIARDVYQGTPFISESVKSERYQKTLEEWLHDYNERYESANHATNKNMTVSPKKEAEFQDLAIKEYLQKNSWKDINSSFKKWLADTAIKNFGSRKDAAKALHCEEKTLYNAREGEPHP